ncbi:MAG: hypothetical protein ABIO70_29045 [Pseudomonadota bacterium]
MSGVLRNGVLFDTNALIDLLGPPGKIAAVGARVTRRQLVCAAPVHVFLEYLRIIEASERRKMKDLLLPGAAGLRIDPWAEADRLRPMGLLDFVIEDALALLEWTVHTFGGEGDFGRFKLGMAVQASQAVYCLGLRAAGVLSGPDDPTWRRVCSAVDGVRAARSPSNSARKAVRQAAPLFREALESEGLLQGFDPARWAAVLAEVYGVCDGAPTATLRKAFRGAPTTLDWLTIGMALRRDLVIITSEKAREFERVRDRCMDLDQLLRELPS